MSLLRDDQNMTAQLEAGVDCVQIFDTWAGSLPADDFEQWSVRPTKAIVEKLRERVPGAKVIGFPRGAGDKIPRYVDETKVSAVSPTGSAPHVNRRASRHAASARPRMRVTIGDATAPKQEILQSSRANSNRAAGPPVGIRWS